MITILKIAPGHKPERVTIPHTLEAMQEIVGGLIQAIYPYEDAVALVCNEEGNLQGLPLNRCLVHEGEVYDIIAGTFLIVGLSSDDFRSLTDEEVKKYTKMYEVPQDFIKINGKIMAIPYIG